MKATESRRFMLQKREACKRLESARELREVDAEMNGLIDSINSLDDYYTTSTCTGRIVLFHDRGSKLESDWIGKWHRRVETPEVLALLEDLPAKGIVWFMAEPTIMHVVSRDIPASNKLLTLAREAGFKRAGIQSCKAERIVVEIFGTERIDAPLAIDGRFISEKGYVDELVRIANEKFEKGLLRLERMRSAINELSKNGNNDGS